MPVFPRVVPGIFLINQESQNIIDPDQGSYDWMATTNYESN